MESNCCESGYQVFNDLLEICEDSSIATGRHGDPDGRISLLMEKWRKKYKLEDRPEKEKMSTEGNIIGLWEAIR